MSDAPYPVVAACRRDSREPISVVPAPLSTPPDSKAAVTRQVSEITIAAGVPLPMSARRVFTKVAGTSALAMLAGVLIVAFTRQPTSASAAPLTSNVSMVAKTVVTKGSSAPERTVRGKVGDSDAPRAGDTAAVAAVAVTTAATPAPHAVRTAHLTTHATTPAKGKAAPASPMKPAKFVPPTSKETSARGHVQGKSAFATVKHTPRPAAPAKRHAASPARTTSHARAKTLHI